MDDRAPLAAPAFAALRAWMNAVSRGADHTEACRRAAEAVADDAWNVVTVAGALARAECVIADRDLGIDSTLRVRPVDSPQVVPVPRGAPYPRTARQGRRARGAFDTPRELARRTVALGREAATGPVRTALDPACGTGAFLVALGEVGIHGDGIELEPAAAAVASVAAPLARVEVGDGLAATGQYDLVVGNPPFVPPERQDKGSRKALQHRFPWLEGRFDLAVPFASVALEAVRPGGGFALCSLGVCCRSRTLARSGAGGSPSTASAPSMARFVSKGRA